MKTRQTRLKACIEIRRFFWLHLRPKTPPLLRINLKCAIGRIEEPQVHYTTFIGVVEK